MICFDIKRFLKDSEYMNQVCNSTWDELEIKKFDTFEEAIKYQKINKIKKMKYVLSNYPTDEECKKLKVKSMNSRNDFDNCFDCGVFMNKNDGTYVKRKRNKIFICKYCSLEMKDKVLKRGNFQWCPGNFDVS